MEAFERLLAEVPWFRRVLALSIVALILWLLATFPAYLILPIVNAVRSRVSAAFERLRTAMVIDAGRQAEQRKAVLEELAKDQEFVTRTIEARGLLRRAVL